MKNRGAGVREYWILDPLRETILIYNFEKETVEIHGFQDRIASGIFEGLEIDFSEFDER